MKKIVIIGAGPAGLAAGFKLCEKKAQPVIIEKNSCVGGLSRSFKYKGYFFDIGPHRFFTKNKLILNWWRDILKEDFLKIKRNTRIYYRRKSFDYPLSVKNLFFNLGLINSLPIFFSYLKSRLWPRKIEDSFEKWIINRFGERLYRIFFKDYTEKVWGIPCAQISADWAAQRIKGLSLSSALRSALFDDQKNTIKTLIKEFYYPRCGAGMMYEAIGNKIIERGGQIRLNTEVVQIKHDYTKVIKLICRNLKDGSLSEIEGSDFCSTMPLNLLISRMSPPASADILKNCSCLRSRSLLLVYLILDCKDLFKDNWLYIHSPHLKVGRIQNFKNWSPDMVKDAAKSSLGLEYFCTEGDSLWRQSDKEIIGLAAKELEILKIAEKKDLSDAFVLRVPDAYPVYDKKYRQRLGIAKDYISRFSNLQPMGRMGMFRYNNMDHSALSGFLAADNIFNHKEDLWEVNMEQPYHGEPEGNSASNF